jgi:tetratricopeptide (TPR) repeat protein
LADGYNAMGKLLGDTGRLKEAEAAFAEALALFKRLAAESPEFPDYSNNVAGRLSTLAKAACMRRDFAAARRLVEEALPYQQAAIQANPRDPDYRQYYRNNLGDLAQSCASQGDRPAALAAAAKLHDLGWDPASDAFAAAWTLARCVAAVEKVDKLDEAMRRAEMQFYADQAMAMVRDAVAKGYKNAAYMKTDKGLDPLREREDFKKVVAELEAAKEAAPRKP